MSSGCSYFGVRIVRHARRDMADLAARGYTGVLHTVSENDLAYYRGTMAEIFEASHAEGLSVQVSPWGLGRTFGGEAESRWVAFHPEACQVMDDGRRVAAACLNRPAYRAFCKDWADVVLDAGADSVFWDEPAWVVPVHVGVDDESRWACRCDACAERFGGTLPTELTPEMQAFREASVVDFLREVVAHVAERGGQNTICLLPSTDGAHGISDWNDVACAAGADDVRDRSVLEALERAGGSVRAPVREAAPRDVRPPRRRRAALAAELRSHRGRDSRARGRGRRRARGGRRRSLDVGLRGVRAHDEPRHAGCTAGLGGDQRRADRPHAAADRGRGAAVRGSRAAHVARARAAAQRRGRVGAGRRRRRGRQARDRDRRDRRTARARADA